MNFLSLPLFTGINDNLLKTLYHDGKILVKTLPPSTILHLEGDLCDTFEIILSGHVRVERINQDGMTLLIASFSSGDVLAANLLFSSLPVFPMTVTTSTKVELLRIDRQTILKLASESQLFLASLLQIISDRSVILGQRLKVITNTSLRQRLTFFLREETQNQRRVTLDLKITKTDLAKRLGVERTSLSRELQKMKKEGLISYTAKTITVTNKTFYNQLITDSDTD